MKLEAGKYYCTRDGRKVGPIYARGGEWVCHDRIDGWFPMWHIETGAANFYTDGPESDMPEFDLIAEWEDEPAKHAPALSSETIDAIAIDSLKWHFKDQDMDLLQLEAFRIVLRYYGVTV